MSKKEKKNTRLNNNLETENSENTTKSINKVKIAIVAIIIIAILSYAFYVLIAIVNKSTDVFIVTNGEVSQEETVNGYIVRDETVVRGQNYKNGMVKIKNEGERVAKGDSILDIILLERKK